jgi:hypothetical protein
VGQVSTKERLPSATPENSLPHSPAASIHTTQWGGEKTDIAGSILKRK